jgi:hypothetical protein
VDDLGHMGQAVVVHNLKADVTDHEVVELMRHARKAQGDGCPSVTCCVAGYDDDPRDLGEVPEVVGPCRRLLNLGYVSFLTPFTSIPGLPGFNRGASLGAYEVWAIAKGLRGRAGRREVPAAQLEEFWADLRGINAVADRNLGGSDS